MNSKKLHLIILFIFFYFSNLIAQESNIKLVDSTKSASIKLPNAPQAEQGDVDFTDGTNSLVRITDEGNFGAIELKNGVPSSTTNKLYNDGGTLKFNGSSLGGGSGATQLNELSDVIFEDGYSLYIGDGSGLLDDKTNNLNTSVGKNTLQFNSSGERNTAVGYEAMIANQTGQRTTAIGAFSMRNNTTGQQNTAIGYQALYSNLTGNLNVAFGEDALYTNSSGYENTSIGFSSLENNTTGFRNVAVGHQALGSNTTGSGNVGVGWLANSGNQGGNNNTIVGFQAGGGSSLHSKSGNVFLGYQAGYNETGNDKLYIENSSSSSPLIYGDFVSDKIGINGKLGVGTTNPSDVLHVVGTTGQNGLRVQVGNATKLRTYSNGGTSLGLNNSSGTPENGLYVHGNTELNADTDIGGNTDIAGSLTVDGSTLLNGSTQIGSNGTPFIEIIKLSGTTSTSQAQNFINYPFGFTQNNTLVLSCKVGNYFTHNLADSFIRVATQSSSSLTITVDPADFGGEPYEIVLMRFN